MPRWMPLVAARLAADSPAQDRDPAQRQPHRHRRAQEDGWCDLESLQIDVRLVETVEEHEAVGALLVELVRESCEISEERD